MALAVFADAQECAYALNPNHTAAQAIPITDSGSEDVGGQRLISNDTVCLAGRLVQGEQDTFIWLVAAGASVHIWIVDVEGATGHETRLDIMSAELSQGAMVPLSVVKLFRFSTEDGAKRTSGEFIVTANRWYVVGL